MQFDFNIQANGGQQIEVVGRFARYMSGLGKIRLKLSRGGFVDLLPGEEVRGVDFTSLLVVDRSGAANAGVIIAGDFEFKSDRASGIVDVVDGGRTRTLAKQAFLASPNLGGAAGQLSHVQLWNPAGSGKNIFIEQVIAASAQTQAVNMRVSNAALSTASAAPLSKNINCGAISVGLCFTQLNATEIAGSGLVYPSSVVAGGQTNLLLKEPICLPPGSGFFIVGIAPNATLGGLIEFFEEPL